MASIVEQEFEYDTTSPMNLSAASLYDEYSYDPRFIKSQQELRTLLFDTARSAGPTRAGTPEEDTDGQDRVAVIEPVAFSYLKEVTSTPERVMWLKNYINEVAPWLDMFDVQQAFGSKILNLAKTSAPLTYAILAISARQMERQRKLQGEHNSLQLYQEAITSLAPQLRVRDPNTLAACVILCCLEMMSAAPRNWRKHLDGCAALFEAYGVHGFSTGIPQAVFWCYARMDLCASIISEGSQPPVLALQHWVPPGTETSEAGSLFRSCNDLDMYANYSVWLCARVCHLSWTRTREHDILTNSPTTEPFIHLWHNLFIEVQDWSQNRPIEMQELDFVVEDSTAARPPFPFVLFSAPHAISSNQLYHATCILLLEMKPPSIDLHDLGHIGSSIWHARRICGISMTNAHHGCLNNAIQPLWLAGKLLSHPAEHKLIANLIELIEAETGWSGTWRLRDLRVLWGYDKDEL